MFHGTAGIFAHGEEPMMNALMNLHMIRHGLLNGEEGQDLVEYALLLSLIALGCITAITPLTGEIVTIFNNITTSLN
jgi:pilus assembly protein Flp/PilA